MVVAITNASSGPDPLVFRPPDHPHILTLSPADSDPYDGEDFGYWDDCDITCPHQPAVPRMPCAVWDYCGCEATAADSPVWDGGEGTGVGPCPTSPTGAHHYIDGEPNQPTARCFTFDWDEAIRDAAFELGLPAGTWLVRPWWDGDTLQLDLIDPLVVTQ